MNGFGSSSNWSRRLVTSSSVSAIFAFTAALQAIVAINLSSISCFAVLATVFISSSVSKNSSFVSRSRHIFGTPVSFIVFSPNSSKTNPAFLNLSRLSLAMSISLCVRVIISGRSIS